MPDFMFIITWSAQNCEYELEYIYFWDFLLIRISRGANNCVQGVFEKNIDFIMILFSPHFKLLLCNEKLDFWELLKIKDQKD